MKTQIVEVTNGPLNWGKFLVGAFDTEWAVPSIISPDFGPLLKQIGWGPLNVLVMDLQTREGAIFYPHRSRSAAADLNEQHRIWVCPLFEPFLGWLYAHADQLGALPPHIDLPEAPFALRGYRRDAEKP